MKRIIFFAYDMNIGGMEKALLLLLNRLVNDYDVTLVLEKKCGKLLPHLDSRIHVREYQVSDSRCVPLRKIINYLHRSIWSILHYHKYDFSCSYATYSVIGSRLALASSTNSSLYIHSNYFDYYGGDAEKIKSFFSLLNSRKFRWLLFVSNESKDKLKNILGEVKRKGVVISNLVDYEEIKQKAKVKEAINVDADKQVFLFVGRLEEESKRLSRLLKAFSSVYRKDKNVRLWIVGDGRDRALCESLVRKYELKDCVKMFGMKVNPYPYIKAADCIVLTSDFEGYPVIYNECMVLDKPIITTISVSDKYIDIRDYATVVEKESGKIAEAMLELKGNKYSEVDFNEINKKRIRDLKEIINGK